MYFKGTDTALPSHLEGTIALLCEKQTLILKKPNKFDFFGKRLVYSKFLLYLCDQNRKTNTTMEATVRQNPVFNPMQIHLLQMFAIDKAEQGLVELKDVLYNYYSTKMQNRLNELWDNGTLDQTRLDQINQMDLHQLN